MVESIDMVLTKLNNRLLALPVVLLLSSTSAFSLGLGRGGPIKSVKCSVLPDQPYQECAIELRKPALPGDKLVITRSTGPTTWDMVEGTTVRTIREAMGDKITGVRYQTGGVGGAMSKTKVKAVKGVGK